MSAELEGDVVVGRRRLLATGFWAAVSAVSVGLAAPLIGYFFGPLFRRQSAKSLQLGPLEDFTLDTPKKVELPFRRRDGWVTAEGRQTAWVVRRADRVMVFDPRCTHLSCAYHWHEQNKEFLCPCHNGVYDIDGRVVSGPPPRPLDVYDTAIRDGVLFAVPVPKRRA